MGNDNIRTVDSDPTDSPTTTAMTSSQRSEWTDQPVDPHPNEDLGYDILPLDIVTVDNGESDHLVLLPSDEAMLKRDSFIIFPDSMLYSLSDYR